MILLYHVQPALFMQADNIYFLNALQMRFLSASIVESSAALIFAAAGSELTKSRSCDIPSFICFSAEAVSSEETASAVFQLFCEFGNLLF